MVLLPFVITVASLFILQQARIGGCCNPKLRAGVPGISPGLALLRRATVSGYTMAADCVSMLRHATVSDYKMAADCASTREICDVFSSLFLPLMLFLLFQVAAERWTSPLNNAGRMTINMDSSSGVVLVRNIYSTNISFSDHSRMLETLPVFRILDFITWIR